MAIQIPFKISNFSKSHDISEETVRKSLEFCILHASDEIDNSGFIGESRTLLVFLRLSLFDLAKTAQEEWHLIRRGHICGTNKMLIAALAFKCGWDGESLD